MSKENNRSFYIIILVIIVIMSIGFYLSLKEKRQLNKSNFYTVGTIVKKYQIPQRGYSIRYRYSVGSTFYENNQKLTVKKELVKIGDKFRVKYSEEDFSTSVIFFDKRIENE